MRFEFASPARILFGPGTVTQIGALARELGRRALVATTSLGPSSRGWRLPWKRMKRRTQSTQASSVPMESWRTRIA